MRSTVFVSDEKVRPLTDTVITSLPDEVTYSINATLIVYDNQDEKAVMAQAQSAITAWESGQSSRLVGILFPARYPPHFSVPGVLQSESGRADRTNPD
ncbi:putative bacteriophage baseplate assembly protein [Salmonella enterica]|uniref:Putative bacteriophage baseplate assembly protein n=1 Tax=Salmonella sp. NCTC 6947 TaxID=2583581 RepID=A0A509B0J8_9ENTR|nr:putative bacteriophage baseplate assembly protein [Salmonella enterica]